MLANRMQTSDPNFVENLRRSLGGGAQATTSSAEETSPEPSNEGDKSPDL